MLPVLSGRTVPGSSPQTGGLRQRHFLPWPGQPHHSNLARARKAVLAPPVEEVEAGPVAPRAGGAAFTHSQNQSTMVGTSLWRHSGPTRQLGGSFLPDPEQRADRVAGNASCLPELRHSPIAGRPPTPACSVCPHHAGFRCGSQQTPSWKSVSPHASRLRSPACCLPVKGRVKGAQLGKMFLHSGAC